MEEIPANQQNNELEKQIQRLMKENGFSPKTSRTEAWLRHNFNTSINHETLKAITYFLRESLGFSIGREYYRRKATLMFWYEQNYDTIMSAIKEKEGTLKFYTADGTTYVLKALQ